MSDSRSTDGELQVRLYELLHERARTERKWLFWRLAAGHLIVGLIVGYAFVSRQWRFIVLTPILYGIAVMDGLKYVVRLFHLERQFVALETKLAEREPLFECVSEYGFFGAGHRVELEGVDLNWMPEIAQLCLVGAIYLTLVAASLLVWTPLGATPTGGFRVTRVHLLVAYVAFTWLFALVAFVGYRHYQQVRDETRNARERAEDG